MHFVRWSFQRYYVPFSRALSLWKIATLTMTPDGREGRQIPFPDSLLTAPQFSTPVEPEIYVEQRSFDTRRDASLYLIRRLGPLGPLRVLGNAYLWSWLGMFYFESIANKDADGNLSIARSRDIAYVIDPKGADKRTFAHRLMLAYEVYVLHRESAWLMLDEPINSLSQFTLRVAGKYEAFRSVGVVDLIHKLYADVRTRRLKEGSGGQSRATAAPGTLPRFLDVLDQLYMTYDVYGMTAEEILPLLPSEFDRFKPID